MKPQSAVDIQSQQDSFTFETPSDSCVECEDPNQANRFYSNVDGDDLSYICGADLLIGASETIKTNITPALANHSTNVVLSMSNLEGVSSDAAFIILTSEPLDETICMVPDSSNEVLIGPLGTEVNNLTDKIEIDQSMAVEPDKASKMRKRKRRVTKEATLEAKTKKKTKETSPVKKKRGRRRHFDKDTKPFCTICQADFTNTASLKTHMLIHSGERPFQCDLCEKTFTRGTVLRIHRRLHTGEKPYKCKSCTSGFVTKEALARHVQKNHPKDADANAQKEKPSFVCEVCQRSLCSKYSLQSHMTLHTRENGEGAGVKCNFCKKDFTCRYTLQRHVFEKHNRRGIITCSVCAEAFASKWEHSKHQEKHTSTRKFQCGLCSKTFTKQFKLLYHLQVHAAEKNARFTCYLCKKEFTSRATFLEHIKGYLEAEMQIYSCPLCPISFSDPRQLKLHLNELHKLPVMSELNYCDICKILSSDANEYYQHLFGKHDDVDILCNECNCFFKSRRQYDEHFLNHDT